jgi:hypothetical protein
MANNWAIVVGINKYKYLPDLNFAEQDALAIQQFLCVEAGFAADQVLLCGDMTEASDDATHTELLIILRNKLHRAQNADNLWFFFSGHGLQDHLMPFDGHPYHVDKTAISIHFVVDHLRACKAKNIVLILDMCRDGQPKTEHKSVESSVEAIRQLVQNRKGQQGIITLFSCGWNERSYELPELRQGAFTYALLEGLRRQSVLRDLERYLAWRVPELHKLAGREKRKQVPLVISEPSWKHEEPILSHYVTAVNVAQLKEMAIDAECDGETEKAIQLWRQVNLVAERQDDRQRALKQIERLLDLLRQVPVQITDTFDFQTSGNQMSGGAIIENRLVEDSSHGVQKYSKWSIDTVALGSICSQSPSSEPAPRESELGIDYRHLQDLLSAGKWRDADAETFKVMLRLAQSLDLKAFKPDLIKQIPCQDLQRINSFWNSYSNHKFSLSIQNKLYQQVDRDFEKFSEKVGWKRGEKWLQYREFAEQEILEGQFPAAWLFLSVMQSKKASSRGRWKENLFSALMRQLINCNI